jgi:hypothetical protein
MSEVWCDVQLVELVFHRQQQQTKTKEIKIKHHSLRRPPTVILLLLRDETLEEQIQME